MNLMQEEGWEDLPYKHGKRKKPKPKKANHQHNYQPILIIGNEHPFRKGQNEYGCVVGYYCTICGKYVSSLPGTSWRDSILGNDSFRDKLNALILQEMQAPSYFSSFGNVISLSKEYFSSKEEIAELLHNILPCYIKDDDLSFFRVKQVELDKVIK